MRPWSLQAKLWLCVALLFASVATLAFSGFRGVYAYRELARSISTRAAELPVAGQLSQSLGDLRVTLSRARSVQYRPADDPTRTLEENNVRHDFRQHVQTIEDAVRKYRQMLEADHATEWLLGDNNQELAALDAISSSLRHIARSKHDPDWMLDSYLIDSLAAEVDEMYELSNTLPQHLHSRMHHFAGEVRGQYRTWIVLSWTTVIGAVFMLGLLLFMFYRWVMCPLQTLIAGSRIIAGGNFNHRVHVTARDEIAELAHALNDMTTRFREIRDDLDHKVKERTKEVIQGEQLASVGFLAAGVAHEINNPLASIAWAAESLVTRLPELLDAADRSEEAVQADAAVVRKYLKCILDEAFRCKGITEKLLDFSRLGDMQKHPTDLRELVEGVIEMIRHLGKYRQKKIEFQAPPMVIAPVEAQQIKQVVLNLLTNALDSLDPGGTVWVEIKKQSAAAEVIVRDNGCGMTAEVREHLFEPFFTRRRDGSGTGLGLSITYRIVQDHGGAIRGESDGPGTGSCFRVTLPLVSAEKNHASVERQEQRLQAA